LPRHPKGWRGFSWFWRERHRGQCPTREGRKPKQGLWSQEAAAGKM